MLPFRKLHGLGNDFVVVDLLDRADGPGHDDLAALLARPAIAARLCDRHLGIGADGLLLILPPHSPGADCLMRIVNADGSKAEMCGNGIRCVAKVLADHRLGLGKKKSLVIDAGACQFPCLLTHGPDGKVCSVKVDMGRPSLEREDLPMTGMGRFVDEGLDVQGQIIHGTAVSMGNPHLVCFLDLLDHNNLEHGPRLLVEKLGPVLEHHHAFPRRTNVEFARMRNDGLEVWVWERGCGLTLACGTGACAAAVAAVVTGRHPAGIPLAVHLPGGTLVIDVSADMSCVWMDGPVEEVFQGELPFPAVNTPCHSAH